MDRRAAAWQQDYGSSSSSSGSWYFRALRSSSSHTQEALVDQTAAAAAGSSSHWQQQQRRVHCWHPSALLARQLGRSGQLTGQSRLQRQQQRQARPVSRQSGLLVTSTKGKEHTAAVADGSDCMAAAAPAAGGGAAAAAMLQAPLHPAAEPLGNSLLPVGMTLADAGSPSQMEVQLVRLMTQSLMPLLPREQYACLMDGLMGLFEPCRLCGVVREQLQCKYAYVQAAVDGGRLAG